jgi:hypothetical protein
MPEFYQELSDEFSNLWLPRFRSLYDKVHASQNAHHAYWKYVLHPDRIKSDYLKDFPWITEVPTWNIDENLIIFFKNSGKDYNHIMAHKDPDNVVWSITMPLYGCDNDTVTTWLDPIENENTYRADASKGYDNNVEMLGCDYKEIESYSFNNRAIIFRSDVWHKARTNHNKDETRVLAKLWVPNLQYEYMQEVLGEYLL